MSKRPEKPPGCYEVENADQLETFLKAERLGLMRRVNEDGCIIFEVTPKFDAVWEAPLFFWLFPK
jgi:hypothetical protein